MKKLCVAAIVVATHAFLTMYSFGVLFGIAHMMPDDRPNVPQVLWGTVLVITWQPLLFLTHEHIRYNGHRVIDTYPYTFTVVNSILAIALGYGIFLGARGFLRKCRHKAAQQGASAEAPTVLR